jgi:hypothetical protein
MEARVKPRTVLLALLIACIASTAVHYTDNTISIDKYPQAGPVNATVVAAAWLLLTPAGILGYWLYTKGKLQAAYAVLAVYSFVGVSTPAHYTEGSFGDFALWRNISILTDGFTGGAILLFVLWSALIAREWARGASAGPSLRQPA